MDWLTPEALKTGSNFIALLVVLYGAYKLLDRIIDVVVAPMASVWTKTVLEISEALAVITVTLNQLHEDFGQLHEDHQEITENLKKLNGK